MHDSNDKWVRRFTTDATSKHKNGFTIYKITSFIFPLASPEAVTVLTVWKRYSDLQNLQRAMKKMHQDLYLKGTCPTYTKWGYFRRFDAEVIEDRKNCTQALLEFIALHPPLFTSTEFVQFFQSSYPDPGVENQNTSSNIESIRSSLLLPVEVMGPLEYQSSEDDSFSTVDSPSVSTIETASLDGSIIYRNNSGQPIAKYPKSPTNNNTRGIVESVADVIMFQEPLQPQILPLTDTNVTSASQSSVTNNNDTASEVINNSNKLNLPDLLSFDNNMEISQISTDSSTDSLSYLDSIPDLSNPKVPANSISKDTDILDSIEKSSETVLSVSSSQSVSSYFSSDQKDFTSTLKKIKSPNKQSTHTKNDTYNGSKDMTDSMNSFSSVRSSSRLETISMDSIFGSSSDLQESYVFEAGYLLSLGARNEAKGEYQKAFDFYKAGIEKMLIGVQGDTNDFRRQFVREKTNKYLSYAEKIYTNHLNNPDSEMPDDLPSSLTKTWDRPFLRHCNVSSLCRPYEDLSKYRVLGIIGGQVMLVLCSETQQCYAMKVIQKTCNQVADEDFFKKPDVDNKLPIMPVKIPYMVKLMAYIETPNLLFLVLQYASGGKLFDYIKNYVKSVPDTPCREVNLENVFIDPETLKKPSNIIIDHINLCKDTVERIEFHKQQEIQNSSKEKDKNESRTEKTRIENIKSNKSDQNAKDEVDLSVTDIVINSQRLLLNVDDALSGRYLKERDSTDCEAKKGKNCDNHSDSAQGDKLTLMVSEVERAFDGLQEKLEQIIMEDDSCKFTVLANRSALPPKSLCNWGAELLTAVDNLHDCGIICRNLNPNNLLLGERGHLMLTYMVGHDTQEALIPLLNEGKLHCDSYVAPELQRFPLLDELYDERVSDFWSFGAIMYELIIGMPLSVAHPSGFNSHTILNMPRNLPKDAESLLSQLLCFDPRERLGSGSKGIEEIKSHIYFKQIDWDAIVQEYM